MVRGRYDDEYLDEAGAWGVEGSESVPACFLDEEDGGESAWAGVESG
jgi:hypothetical protein